MASLEERLAPHRDAMSDAEARLDVLRKARDAEVVACLRDGYRPVDVARAVGVSRKTVYEIRDTATQPID